MHLKILSLNCEKGYIVSITKFLADIFAGERYDFVLLQELGARQSPPFDPSLTAILDNYSLLTAFNEEVGAKSELGLAYRKSFSVEESTFVPFSPFQWFDRLLPEFGLLAGTFRTPEGRVRIGTFHAHPSVYFSARTREREVKLAKRELLAHGDENLAIIFGGDFNNGVIGEKRRSRKALSPEFVNVTNDMGPTADTRYLEPTTRINALAHAATKLTGFHLLATIDHIYADSKTATTHKFECRILADRVSDHSPLEVILSPDRGA